MLYLYRSTRRRGDLPHSGKIYNDLEHTDHADHTYHTDRVYEACRDDMLRRICVQ